MVAGIPSHKSEGNQEFSPETAKIITLHESASTERTLSSETFFAKYFYSFESENKEHITSYPSIVSYNIISKKQSYHNLFLTSKNGINAPPIV